jgi:hypothetical protein
MWSDSIHAPAFKRRFSTMLDLMDITGIGERPPAEYPLS